MERQREASRWTLKLASFSPNFPGKGGIRWIYAQPTPLIGKNERMIFGTT